jgi:Hemolysin coregulated protein Hcp (TssD)
MSFLSKLTVDSISYSVLECKYKFFQDSDNTGKPFGLARGGRIKIKIEANSSTDFLDWMLQSSKKKDGEITFYKRDAMSRLRSIKFVKGYCVSYQEIFNAQNTEPLLIKMTICAQKLTIGDCESVQAWKI